jgi:hypothetical protein
MKKLLVFLFLCTIFTAAKAQTTATEKKTDTIARLAVRFMNANLPDSVYLLTGD